MIRTSESLVKQQYYSIGNMAIKILLFDDSKHIRESLALLFETDDRFEWKGSYASTDQAEELITISRPDVVLMDIDMPGRNGIASVGDIRQQFPDLPILMLTVFDDTDRVFDSLRRGAMGYLLKSTAPDKLIAALIEVSEGGAPMTPSIARKVMMHLQEEGHFHKVDYHLTAREKEVLTLLVEGQSYKMIAGHLEIGFETVRSHIKKIYDKLHVQSMTEAVAKTLREKLI
jgi:DNA-binding NarL/FixJ family response regulator